ncbi:MAG: hypothetical protein LBH91_00345 [Prevotellaceae bacterium]|jgi:F0F1-type ATP synthase assembly protein I|nr:hypothetical protein [Prevotellaceae bacterium]
MKQEKKLKRRLIVSLLTSIVIAGIVTGLALYYIFPASWFQWYPLIPAYFVLLGLITSIVTNYYRKEEPRKAINSFMMMKGLKIMLTIVGILLYYWLVNENMTEALLLAFGFYMLHLFVETLLLYRFEKASKQNV